MGAYVGPWVEILRSGGPLTGVTALFGALALALAAQRWLTLMYRFRLDAPTFMEITGKLVRAGNLDRAVKLCDTAPSAPLAQVIRAGLARAPQGKRAVSEPMEAAIGERAPALHARIGWLKPLALCGAASGIAA